MKNYDPLNDFWRNFKENADSVRIVACGIALLAAIIVVIVVCKSL